METVETDSPKLVAELSFRSATANDLPALKRMYAQLIPDEHPKLEDMRRTLAELEAHPRGGIVVVGVVGGKVVATCQIVVYENLVRTPRCKAVIDSVVVDSDYRGRGIGRHMMEWSLEWLAQRNCSRIIVATAYNREVAHEMYRKLGFERSGYEFIYSFPPLN